MQKNKVFSLLVIVFLLGALMLVGCRGQKAKANIVSGTIESTANVTLPDKVTMDLKIFDATAKDLVPFPLGKATIDAPGKFPLSFEIPFKPADFDPKHNYYVFVSIKDSNGHEILKSDENALVITNGNPVSGVKVNVLPTK